MVIDAKELVGVVIQSSTKHLKDEQVCKHNKLNFIYDSIVINIYSLVCKMNSKQNYLNNNNYYSIL